MTQGWSTGLLFGVVLLLISRLSLHIGGFWDSNILQRAERRFPMAAQIFSFESVKRRRERLAAHRFPFFSLLDRFDQITMLAVAIVTGVLGIWILFVVFLGEPL